jgi:putative Holliday junction resolvase
MKYLGIDYGSKKVGFANSDDEGKFAFPLMIAPNDKNILKDTVELIKEMKVTNVVIGESVDAQGKRNPIAKEARAFGMDIEKMIDVQIAFEKEWYSTVEARKQPGKGGDHEVDDQAAAIVLQRYLDKINGPGEVADEYESEDDVEEDSGSRDNW